MDSTLKIVKVVGLWKEENKRNILEYLVNGCIQILEPVSELLITLNVIDQRVCSIEDSIYTLEISEPFEEGATPT